ncbi:hypothetical protein M8J77_020796 [Diaphorina citri]|nr:hypothetical protein M8J77_020796 [Diaphorina citri]
MKSVANAPARSKPAPGPTPARTDPISTTDQTAKPRSRTQTKPRPVGLAGGLNSVTFTKSYCCPHNTAILILLIPHSQLYDLHNTPFLILLIPHRQLCELHNTPFLILLIPHSQLCDLHNTPFLILLIPHSQLFDLHYTPFLILLIPHSQLCDLHEVILLSSQYHNPHIANPT